jgi:hypothetical protein
MKTTRENRRKQASDRSAVVDRVRQFVREQLAAGTTAPDLSFALGYVATDLGLAIARDARQVFPVVLDGIARASLAHLEANKAQSSDQRVKPSETPEEVAVPADRTLH